MYSLSSIQELNQVGVVSGNVPCLLHCCPLETLYTTLFLLVLFPRGMVVSLTQACPPPGAVFGTVRRKEGSELHSVSAAAIPEGHPE